MDKQVFSQCGTTVIMSITSLCVTGDVPFVDLPDYVNRTLWFDTSSSNIRLYFNMQVNTDPNLAITSAVIKLHLKRRDGKYTTSNEPAHEIMALSVLRKLILQMRMGAAIQCLMSDVWSDTSSTSILHVCEQRSLWRRQSLHWSPTW